MRRRWSAVLMAAAEQSNVIRTGVGSTLAHGTPTGTAAPTGGVGTPC
ncbi:MULTISPECIES: hypothetical protein [Streptomyces]|nr:hypothetical protein [Streptomyces virginiae]